MTYVTYSSSGGPFGPWTNGGPPGISASVLTAMEAFMNAGWFDSSITSNGSGVMTSLGQTVNGPIKNNVSVITVNGGSSGSGSVSLWQDCQGNVKRVLIYMTSYKAGTTAQTIALPTAFTKGAHIRTGGIGTSGTSGGIQLLSSSTPQSVLIYTALAAAGGSVASQTTVYAYSYGECNSAFDTVSFPLNTSTAHSAFMLIEGQ